MKNFDRNKPEILHPVRKAVQNSHLTRWHPVTSEIIEEESPFTVFSHLSSEAVNLHHLDLNHEYVSTTLPSLFH